MNTPEGAVIQIPIYQCHKKVGALKIADIVRDGEGENRDSDGSAILKFENTDFAPIFVTRDYMYKHTPTIGGYYVVYEDGYLSFSPAEAFESGYTLIE